MPSSPTSEIDNLIFLPGFSTAKAVSNISGRGVGMDVVKRSIQALGGRISIASRPGQGSTFTMSLPLTLAVLDGMVVKVAGQTLVVPLTAIVETLQPEAERRAQLGRRRPVIAMRGSFMPLIDVGRELGYRARADRPAGQRGTAGRDGRRRPLRLLVDAIQDQRQVVIKSLEANYGHVPGIAAATILGDGRVALILDVDAVVAGCGQERRASANPPWRPQVERMAIIETSSSGRGTARKGGRSLVPGEFLLTGDDFQQIAAMLHEDAGIHLPESKATLVYSRLAKRLRALGLESFRDYCALVASSEGSTSARRCWRR